MKSSLLQLVSVVVVVVVHTFAGAG